MAGYRNHMHDHGRRVNNNHRSRRGRDMESPRQCVRDTLTEVSRLMLEVRDFKRTVVRGRRSLFLDRNGTTSLKVSLNIVRDYIRDIEDLLPPSPPPPPTASSSHWESHLSSPTSSDSSYSNSSDSDWPSPRRNFRLVGVRAGRSPVLPARSHDHDLQLHRSRSRSPPCTQSRSRSPVRWPPRNIIYSPRSRSPPSTQFRSPVRRAPPQNMSRVSRPPSSQLSPSRPPSRSPSTHRPRAPNDLPRSCSPAQSYDSWEHDS